MTVWIVEIEVHDYDAVHSRNNYCKGVTFVLDEQSRKRNFLRKEADGLYVGDRGGVILYVRYGGRPATAA